MREDEDYAIEDEQHNNEEEELNTEPKKRLTLSNVL